MRKVTISEFMDLSRSIPVIDVRSPGEFAEGHIPGAYNLPVFDNQERAIIGTLYKQENRQKAIGKGLEIVGPKMSAMAREAQNVALNNQLAVHCWRGGMRSESMAWLFEQVKIECYVLEGGYKNYRQYVLDSFTNIPHLIVLSGHTGSGKTEILKELQKLGEQIIDLEDLAHHKGSVFGGIGQTEQPTTQQFQNDLLAKLKTLDLSKRIWVEGESLTIGKVFLPEKLWDKMSQVPHIEIHIPITDRIDRLVEEYGLQPQEPMEQAILNLGNRIGSHRMTRLLDIYRQNDLRQVAEQLLEYYDHTYQFGRDKKPRQIYPLHLDQGDVVKNAEQILNFYLAQNLEQNN